MSAAGLAEARRRMVQHGESEEAVLAFERSYAELEHVLATGPAGPSRSRRSTRLTDVPSLEDYSPSDEAMAAALRQVAMVKLNGGLGTSMGITGPKSALVVKDGLSFLDVIARQTLALRKEYGVHLPLILMNSFRTRDESLADPRPIPRPRDRRAAAGLPAERRAQAARGQPLARRLARRPRARVVPARPRRRLSPPAATGLLQGLLDKGFRYVFLSNADNLGATCDPGSRPGWWRTTSLTSPRSTTGPSTTARAVSSRSARATASLVLRDSAMVEPQDEEQFQDHTLHTTFHANNLWVDLHALDRLLKDSASRGEAGIGLPVIVNRKTVDPSDASSPDVIQIETAMGGAVVRIDGARAHPCPPDAVPPVKTTNELLLVRSDIFELGRPVQHRLGDHPPGTVRRPGQAVQAGSRIRAAVSPGRAVVARGYGPPGGGRRDLRRRRRLHRRGDPKAATPATVEEGRRLDRGDRARRDRLTCEAWRSTSPPSSPRSRPPTRSGSRCRSVSDWSSGRT